MILRRPVLADRVVRLPVADRPELHVAAVTEVQGAPPLTVSTVIEWLAAQTDTVREAVASELLTELTELTEHARVSGHAAGQAAGEAAAAVEQTRVLDLLRATITEFAQARDAAAAALEPACADLVAHAFLKLAGPGLVLPAATVGAVREALRDLAGETRVRLRVHPTDLPAVALARPLLEQAVPGVECELVSDDTVSAGGCRLDTSLGTLDAGFETQLSAALATLRAARGGHRNVL